MIKLHNYNRFCIQYLPRNSKPDLSLLVWYPLSSFLFYSVGRNDYEINLNDHKFMLKLSLIALFNRSVIPIKYFTFFFKMTSPRNHLIRIWTQTLHRLLRTDPSRYSFSCCNHIQTRTDRLVSFAEKDTWQIFKNF